MAEKYVTLTGQCFCGEVKYEIKGALTDARSCHCSRCRKAFSSQASSSALVKPSDFQWVSGANLLSTFSSQKEFGLQFCSKCGSTLCGLYKDEIHGVTLGCLNDDPHIEISRHIFVGSKASWEIIPDAAIQYQEHVLENT
jgi:hypothetical protein